MNDQQRLDHLRRHGFVYLDGLSPEEIDDVLSFLLSRPVYVDAHVPQTERNRGTDNRFDRAASFGSECVCVHTDDAILTPHLFERGLAMTDLASKYLERDPAVAYSANAFWTRAGRGPVRPDIQAFHVDQDDVRFLAMFAFLSDVITDEDGPQDIVGPNGETCSIRGRIGTVFLADTSLSHRGRKPTRGERGLYWWRWGVSDRPAANAWDKIEPISASRLGDRYPTDPRLQESIKLLVSP